MLDIGFTELLLVAVIALVVLGPERLPQAIRTTAYWVGKIRRSFQSVKEELEREIDADGIKQQLHNEAVMKELNKTREQFQSQINDLKKSVSIDTVEDQTSSDVNTSPERDSRSVGPDDSVERMAVNKTSSHLSQEKDRQ
ncbi:Sec-independent protein translocase protein TatB [Endozoicomonas sp. SCSIO W0465]|uniref:Sec-independent protein translocase protein TatB n=1 Tax=Endozoicomonas sp. SCSIO W0465 TaxID=2918516 RepID=UPI002074BB7B|nr:Sec-independent protein translocase protein TatB [Endozoicomonas sp. SCSIO W0465]USE35339.1 Sec-independent protein translocase protein TatB [Endozoicomonas sp. SCSIO W0465]